MALARAVGARGILVRTGYGAAEEEEPPPDLTADVVADNLSKPPAGFFAISNPPSDQSAMMFIARSVHPLPGEAERRERLLALVDGFSSRRVLVVGDLIADEFIYGEVARVSREAPVLILKYDATEMVAGGAGNAANNVAALGGRARLAGMVGADPEGRRLLASFHRGRRSLAHRPRARVPDAGEDAHSGRRHPFRASSRSSASIARPAGR